MIYDFVGLAFIVAVIYLTYLFVANKHRKIVDHEPDMLLNGLAVKRMEQGQSLEEAFQLKQTTFGR